jgi:hypothetical protein
VGGVCSTPPHAAIVTRAPSEAKNAGPFN